MRAQLYRCDFLLINVAAQSPPHQHTSRDGYRASSEGGDVQVRDCHDWLPIHLRFNFNTGLNRRGTALNLHLAKVTCVADTPHVWVGA